MQAKWIDSSQQEFAAQIKLSGIDNLGLVNNITKVISSNMHVNMKSISFETDDGVFSGKINVVVTNINMLNKLIQNLKKINGIHKVSRI
jgi:GTP pyrophosphokinase